LRRRALLAAGVRALSQLRTRYPHSPISAETDAAARLPRLGTRLRDATVTTAAGPARLHAVTAVPAIHVLLERDAHLRWQPPGEHVRVHRLLDRPGTGLVAVRPDGYVGFRSATADAAALHRWLELLQVATAGPGPRPVPGSDRSPRSAVQRVAHDPGD
jgi:hypothetical protein